MRSILFIFIFFSLPLYASDIVEVRITVSTDGKPDNAVREEGKLKAIDKAIERLPQLIEGKETLNNGMFIEHIKAVSYSVVNFELLSERWERDKQAYHLVANVSLDMERSFGLLSKLSANKAKINALMDAYSSFQSALNQNMAGYDFLEAFSEYEKLNLASIATPDINQLAKANEERRNVFVEKYNELMRHIAASMEIALIDVNVEAMTADYEVTGLNPYKEIQKLLAFLGDTTVDLNLMASVCGFSNADYHFKYSPNPFYNHKQGETVTLPNTDSVKFGFTYEHFNVQDWLESVEETFTAKACF
ncbi:hypothetical protein I633_22511 (plasmid) [Alteromonas mediterranea 615]|uniref:Uncharacterized protein n=1 Tax=Alteromonas mediterranea 615 TaxID=1300253 RepID=S5AIC4_9ALTE|nr:hypothetical protein I633_22511 [Alteromonas mediterranea 615]|tara:strand:- start:4365 stop:5279 length:915 start_codon:yes stop_codon:yes gene_type:complete